jgi:hypothetical protein
MHLFIWITAVVGLAIWSALAWGLCKLLSLEPGWAADLRAVIERVPYGEVFDRWFPGWRELAQLALELMQSAIVHASGAAPLIAGIAWGVGAVMVLALAALASLLVWLLRDKPSPAAQPPA